MSFRAVLLFLNVVIQLATGLAESSANITCDPLDNLSPSDCSCVCRLSDTKTLIDLRSLVYNGTRFEVQDYSNKSWYFAWSPCQDFDMFADKPDVTQSCKSTGLARFTKEPKACYSLGSHTSTWFSVIPQESDPIVVVHFRSSPGSEVIQVKLVCDREGNENKLSYNEIKPGIPEFFFHSRCGCGNGCLTGQGIQHAASHNESDSLQFQDSTPETLITCDPLPHLPSNETYCVCQLSDSKNLIDLRPLARSGDKPKFITEHQWWYFAWSPCKDFGIFTHLPKIPFVAEPCKSTAMKPRSVTIRWKATEQYFHLLARFTNGSTHRCKDLGNHNTSMIKVHGRDPKQTVSIVFSIDGERKAIVNLVCTRPNNKSTFVYKTTRRQTGVWVFEFHSPNSCEISINPTSTPSPGRPKPPKPVPQGGIIGGSIGGVVGVLLLTLLTVKIVKGYRQRQAGRMPGEHVWPPPDEGHAGEIQPLLA